MMTGPECVTPNNRPDVESRFVLAFYGIESSANLTETFFSFTTEWFTALGCPPNKLAVTAPGFSGKVGSFKTQAAKLRKTGFDDIEALDTFSCPPGVAIPMQEYTAVGSLSNLSKYGGYAVIAVPATFATRAAWLPAARELVAVLHPSYGIGYSRPLRSGPDAYAIGLCVGWPLEDIAGWLRDGMRRQVYRAGKLRDVYEYNFLTRPQLTRVLPAYGDIICASFAIDSTSFAEETLESWIRGDPSRGVLHKIDELVTLWEVDASNITPVRNALRNRGAIFSDGEQFPIPGSTVSVLPREAAIDEMQLETRLRMTVPSCLQGFQATPAQLPEPFDDSVCSVWQLACHCGGTTGRLLGYLLDEDDDTPECFLSPLAFECAACNAVTELLDTDRHGYHAEVARLEGGGVGSTKLRNDGPRDAYSCPACGRQVFEMTVGFVFWHLDELAEDFDDAWEDLFNVFLCHCKCAGCGQSSQPTDFAKL